MRNGTMGCALSSSQALPDFLIPTPPNMCDSQVIPCVCMCVSGYVASGL